MHTHTHTHTHTLPYTYIHTHIKIFIYISNIHECMDLHIIDIDVDMHIVTYTATDLVTQLPTDLPTSPHAGMRMHMHMCVRVCVYVYAIIVQAKVRDTHEHNMLLGLPCLLLQNLVPRCPIAHVSNRYRNIIRHVEGVRFGGNAGQGPETLTCLLVSGGVDLAEDADHEDNHDHLIVWSLGFRSRV